MATASVTNLFVDATAAEAAEVNRNFDDVVNFLNDEVVHVDGTTSMTASFDAGSNKIVNVSGGTADTDAANIANVAAILPAGMMTQFGGSSAPDGWLLCNGDAVGRVTYSALFAVIGTTFGAGDGSTTFNVPNMADRYAIGKSGTVAVGASVGSNDAVAVAHTHNTADHTHPLNGSGAATNGGTHNHSYTETYQTGGDVTLGSGVQYWTTRTSNTGGTGAHSHGLTGNTSGASTGNTTNSQSPTSTGTNTNRPASVGLNWIIRTGV